MAAPVPEINFCLPAICSHSLGRVDAGHDLRTRLRLAAAHNFKGVEIFYQDIDVLASNLPGGPTPSNLMVVAHEIGKLTESLNLRVVDLQPIAQYEGLINRNEHEKDIEKAKLWFKLAKALGTDLIIISSNDLPANECTSDFSTIVRDLLEIADLGACEKPPIRFAFESMCWGTHINTWQGMHAVVSSVNRWNFGYCFDTFHIAGLVYADPTSADGKAENAERALADSLREMVESVDRKKIFSIQLADGERLSSPLTKDHAWYDSSQPARKTWSRNARLFLYEEDRGGYLPVEDVCRALLEGLGYRGFLSFEIFSRTLFETDDEVPHDDVTRAQTSWRKLTEKFPNILGKSVEAGGRLLVEN